MSNHEIHGEVENTALSNVKNSKIIDGAIASALKHNIKLEAGKENPGAGEEASAEADKGAGRAER